MNNQLWTESKVFQFWSRDHLVQLRLRPICCFHGIVVPGTLRDSIFVLEGLLEQQTGVRPTEIMTDTSGVSDMVFGLFWLLGYQFSPRLADAGEAVFWRIDKSADYGPLDEVARGCINTQRAAQHWDDMLRIAGSLKLGTV